MTWWLKTNRSKEVRKLLLRIAKKDTTILLNGESGTGKGNGSPGDPQCLG